MFTGIETLTPGQAIAIALPEKCPFAPTLLGLRILSKRYTFIPESIKTETGPFGLKKCRGVFIMSEFGTEEISNVCTNCPIQTRGIR
jgi:hypothetical protein